MLYRVYMRALLPLVFLAACAPAHECPPVSACPRERAPLPVAPVQAPLRHEILVRVETDRARGSATLIYQVRQENGLLTQRYLTAAHVVRDHWDRVSEHQNISIQVFATPDYQHPATTLAVDTMYFHLDYDAAVLEVVDVWGGPWAPPAELRWSTPEIAELVTGVGYPLGEALGIYEGYVSSTRIGWEKFGPLHQAGMFTIPGMSGGAVYDTERRLLGVINAKFYASEGALFFLSLNVLQDWLAPMVGATPR